MRSELDAQHRDSVAQLLNAELVAISHGLYSFFVEGAEAIYGEGVALLRPETIEGTAVEIFGIFSEYVPIGTSGIIVFDECN